MRAALFGAVLLGAVLLGAIAFYLTRPAPPPQADGPTALHLMRMLWQLPPNALEDDLFAALRAADAFWEKAPNCQEFDRPVPYGAVFRDFGWVSVDDLPIRIRNEAMRQPIDIPIRGVRDDTGVLVYVVCGRK